MADVPKRNGPGIELLADPTRRRIVALIARNVRRPSRLAAELGLSRPAVSRQLRLLREADLIEWRAFPGDQRGISYYLNHRMAAAIVAWLAGTEVGLSPLDRSDQVFAPIVSDLARVSRPGAVDGQPEVVDGDGRSV